MSALPSQRWPEPPYERMSEPTEAEIAERIAIVRQAWEQDEAKFIELMCDALTEAKPHVQEMLASFVHQGDYSAFGGVASVLFERKLIAEVKQRAEDELAGLV